jgi:carboxyl-terminal processing protease
LPEGEIFITVDSYGNEDIIFSDADMLDVPAVVLVDRNSFSAAEFFAAIMREFDYAIIVGEQTSGKSRMQTVHMLPEGNAINLSTAEYLTKNRVSLEDAGGVTPDYLIEFTDDQFTDFIFGSLDIDDDPHIQKALYLLGIN